MLYDRVADLPLTIDRFDFDRLESETTSDFTRTTTVVTATGDGEHGHGEDVIYDEAYHDDFGETPPSIPTDGITTFREFSNTLERVNLFDNEPLDRPIFRAFRRWAFESAALDLALRQQQTSLAAVLGRSYEPVRFVVSTRLGEPPTTDRVLDWLDRAPDLEFKLDPTTEWSSALAERLASTDAVRILDLKGQYEDADVTQDPDPELYRMVLETFPEAIIEDPVITEDTTPLFVGSEDRVSWDYPIRDVESVRNRPWPPTWINIKPSRFGSVASLFETIEYCLDNDIAMYGGGQFELGPGRRQLHALASLFYATAPNDVAPSGYNLPTPPAELPSSPIAPPSDPRGFTWASTTRE